MIFIIYPYYFENPFGTYYETVLGTVLKALRKKRYMQPNDHSSTIYHTQDIEAT